MIINLLDQIKEKEFKKAEEKFIDLLIKDNK